MSHVTVTISGFLCDLISESGHVISAPISGHIETDIDTDIGYTQIISKSGSTSANWALLILLMKIIIYLGYLRYL